MKRSIALLFAALMLLCLAACRKDASVKSETPAEVRNTLQQLPDALSAPEGEVQTYASLDELNRRTGAQIALPEDWQIQGEFFEAMAIDDTAIGQYVFTADGLACSVRFCPDITRDITGVVGPGGGPIFDGVKGDTVFAEDCILGRWNTGAGQYVLYAATQDIEVFSDLFERLRAAIPG